MKLYFYILESPYSSSTEMKYEECEVAENIGHYESVDGFPDGYYGKCVLKKDIGVISGSCRNVVILEEPDVFFAKKLFSSVIINEIRDLKDRIREEEKKLAVVNAFGGR